MKQLLILSGKGGTGKTTVASAFIHLLQAKAYADCDVDAPNLHLVMASQPASQQQDFFALQVAVVDRSICQECGECLNHCRFDAIERQEGGFAVNPYACEGCGVCVAVCPHRAVNMVDDAAGSLMLYEDSTHVFSTARLKMGKGTSGLLVTEVKRRMNSSPRATEGIAIIDGSPGIGCPVIASLSGVNMVLLVAEPSVSGLSDMKRILKTARHFEVEVVVCVNKYDTNHAITAEIIHFCRSEAVKFVGKIPYDKAAPEAINNGMSIVEIDCPSGLAVTDIFTKTIELLGANA